MGSDADILAIASAEDSTALFSVVLGAEAVAPGLRLCIARPPFAEDQINPITPRARRRMPRREIQFDGSPGKSAIVSVCFGRGSRRDGRGQWFG